MATHLSCPIAVVCPHRIHSCSNCCSATAVTTAIATVAHQHQPPLPFANIAAVMSRHKDGRDTGLAYPTVLDSRNLSFEISLQIIIVLLSTILNGSMWFLLRCQLRGPQQRKTLETFEAIESGLSERLFRRVSRMNKESFQWLYTSLQPHLDVVFFPDGGGVVVLTPHIWKCKWLEVVELDVHGHPISLLGHRHHFADAKKHIRLPRGYPNGRYDSNCKLWKRMAWHALGQRMYYLCNG